MDKYLLYGLPEVYGDYKETSHDPMKHEDASYLMLMTKKILDENNIKFIPMFGTLLGMIRDKDFIPHDFDMDILLFDRDREKFIDLFAEFEQYGIKMIRCVQPWIYTLEYGSAKCDYNPILEAPSFLKWRYCIVEQKYMQKSFFENTEKYEFLGELFDVPANPEHILEYLYGKTWRTPIKGARAHVESNVFIHRKIYNVYHRCVRYVKRHWLHTLD